MWSIYKKDLSQFFSSLTGYVAVSIFLLVLGLNVFVFEGNVFETGYATLDIFFTLTPWILILIIPAITMRSFAEELHSGTYEMLATKPLSETQILLGKFFAASTLFVIALAPTLLYFVAISSLDIEGAGIDTGATWGSYIGLLLIGFVFCSIGILSSILSSNQIVAFLLGVFLCYLTFDAFLRISSLSFFSGQMSYIIMSLGASSHYDAISRGVIDTSDLFYFFGLTIFILMLSRFYLESKKW
ncbi:MAG: ABC transporter permease subunit [Chitinophagales bacterium]|nr:ABC transporter permease subunit [Chitinophagales bacterium]MCZ2392479.1 ABC transporter permease subunit [Chitinophagales bacterium]